jgi:cytochrome P450
MQTSNVDVDICVHSEEATMQSAATPAVRLPRPLPLLGHALQLLRDPWGFLAAARPLGDIVKIRLGTSPAYIINNPDLIRQVLVVDAKKFGKGVQFDKLRPILGNGLITADGEEHLKHRRLVQPAFHHSRIVAYAKTMRELSVEKAESWRDGVPVALDDEIKQLTLKVVAKTLFSTELGGQVVDEVVRSMPTVLNGINKRALAPTQLLEKLPTPENRRFNEANRRLRAVVDRIIAGYRRSDADHGDVVSMLLLARDEDTGEGLSDTQVRDEVITMVMAGTETTANLLSWVWHVLGQRPDLEARLHAEVDEVLGKGDEALGKGDEVLGEVAGEGDEVLGEGVSRERGMGLEDIGRLAFTRRLISETLRVYPPGWLLTRRAREAVTLGGVDLPTGASVMVSPFSVHRDPRLYAAADIFDPDRWLPEQAEEIPRPAFLPFGAGNRQCIGDGFAWTEATVILATIAHRWRLRPVPGVDVRMMPRATLTPSALPMVPRRRLREPALIPP